jgi:hypothetical protein
MLRRRLSKALKGFFKHKPTVGAVPHFAPSGAPPLGQKTDTRVSLDSQVTDPSAWTALRLVVAASLFVALITFLTWCSLGTLWPLSTGWTLDSSDALYALSTLWASGTLWTESPLGPGSLPQAASESETPIVRMEKIHDGPCAVCTLRQCRAVSISACVRRLRWT